MIAIDCAAARELAPDLALGALPGDDRARVLAHIEGCSTCESLVAELALVADSMLQLAPAVEPPAGFESRVLARIDASQVDQPRPLAIHRSRRRWIAIVAAAAALLIAAGGASIYALRRPDRYPQSAGGVLRAGALVGARDETWGEAIVSEGQSSWVFVAMWWDVPDGTYHVEVDRAGQPGTSVSDLRLIHGEGSVGAVLSQPQSVTGIRVVDAAGHTICAATLSRA